MYIQIKDLSLSYFGKERQETKALAKVNFSINKGEFVAIIGPSGCGKTTLLNCIDGLIKPTKGQVKINNKNILGPGMDRAYVFQDPLLLPWRNVFANIAFGGEMQGMERSAVNIKTQDLINKMHLQKFEKYYPNELSGGMKQRVNIARALCISPEIVLFDEPFSNLDSQTRENMQREILDIYSDNKKTFIFVTHNIEEAIYLSDRIIIMSKHPGAVKKIIKVNLKRPRILSIKDSRDFIDLKRQINKIIQNEI